MYLLLPFVALAAELFADQGLSIGELTCSRRCTCMLTPPDLCGLSVPFKLLMCHGTLVEKVWQTHTRVGMFLSL